jgi:hypothetical protein
VGQAFKPDKRTGRLNDTAVMLESLTFARAAVFSSGRD